MKTEFYNKLVCTEGLSKLDWLKWRQKGIGGSDIASVCGINPWHSGLALYYDKTEEIKEGEEENIPAELGTFLEPFMKVKFEKWAKKSPDVGIPIQVESLHYILQHPTNKIALANIDGLFKFHIPEGWVIHDTELLHKGYILVEYKTTSERNYKEWKDDNLPDYYYLQTQWYLYVTNYRFCYLAFLIGNRKFDVKLIERNEEVIKQIVEKANYFWNAFVIPKVLPAPDGTESSKEALAKLYPKEEEGKIIRIEGEEHEIRFGYLEKLKLDKKEAELKIEEVNQFYKAIMQDAEIAICGKKKITWKEVEKKEYTVKASKSRQFRISNYKGGNE